ncbi:toxin-antitoxin system YwqK family antitoxin [Poritiphilus flavus]|uniref:MORN repeat variant n=1 Tax=Poritiphilus flavus TaxID=2697053 RepID=A0A6L9EDG6_9FLAO|nr:hypothetical protein [Poritiphilus flavus]NAS12672.1 hypothetical protein [Poritiphilus flavus]
MNRTIICFLIGTIFCSCNEVAKSSATVEYFANGNVKSKTSFSSGKKTVFQYFKNHKDTVEIIYRYQDDSLKHMMHYHSNGNLRKIGKLYLDSLKIGKWKFYERDGNLKDIREYLLIDGKSYLNQRWIFNVDGDTIGGNYFELKMKDTIAQGQGNRFHFFLKEPLFSYKSESYVLMPKEGQKVEKDFSNQYSIEWDTINSIGTKYRFNEELRVRNHDIILDAFAKEKGKMNLRGIIVEKHLEGVGDSIDFKTRNIYFNIPYVVK